MTNAEAGEPDHVLGESAEELRSSQLAHLENLVGYTRRLLAISPERHELQEWLSMTLADIEKIRAGIHVPDPLLEEKERVQREIRAEFPTMKEYADYVNASARKAGSRVIEAPAPRRNRVFRARKRRDEEAAD